MRRTTLCGVALVVMACSEETGPNISDVPGLNITRLEISPKLHTIFAADTARPIDRLQMTARVFGWTGDEIAGVKVAWSSSNTAVATVSETGLVTPTGFGTTEITASATKVAKATITVASATRAIQVTPGVDTIFVEDPIALRDTLRLKATAFDDTGALVIGTKFSWTSSSPAIATVDASGLVSAKTLGVATITAQSGDRTRSATLRVAPVVKAIQVTAAATTVLARDTVQLTAVALGWDDKPMTGRTITWTSSNTSVATIDTSRRAIFLRAGTARFTAKSAQSTGEVSVTALERQLQSVSSGDDFSCGFANLGRGYCWGVGELGQLGSTADSACFDGVSQVRGGGRFACTLSPKRHAGPALEFFAIDAGGNSACGITRDKLIYCWGDDTFGQIGHGSRGAAAQPSLASVGQERFDSITVGRAHACALSTARQAYCWGRDSLGQLGDDRFVNSTTPIPVVGGRTFSAISAGGEHTCGISGGEAFCWGSNVQGQLGNGAIGVHSAVPVAVAGGHTFTAISAGWQHTCALTSSGQVMCWGGNSNAQASGDGVGSPPIAQPTAVGSATYTMISSGTYHSCALAVGGTVSCWGWNEWGQAGNGTTSIAAPAAAVVSTLLFRSVSAGAEHTCAIGTDNETYCWGSDVLGMLGNDLQAEFRATPQKVAVPR
jgi:alpha-tubulin suppressor-like RCC1 family protein/uncharacterized protein YjdB